ncbi:MAG TPA: hypothetical protein VMG40_05060 [Bryobacteraceae bacterium]|nr:hypothetical protein [Bryobacteraceae bacterium]
MKYKLVLLTAICVRCACAQEASSGIELSGTISVEGLGSPQLSDPPHDGSIAAGGFRVVLYPVWKIDDHWAVSAALQAYSDPYFYDQFTAPGESLRGNVLQANVSYSQFFSDGSLVIRAGELSSAFGSFLLRYDDAVNPLIDVPLTYGYYYEGVSTLALTGVEADATLGKLDARVQFTNSSPMNPRSPFDHDQYGNWTAGGGYTIRQGLRVGASLYRGPYLDRDYPYYFPGEWPPNRLPATAIGLDAKWGRGPWNLYGEWQRFQFDYHVIPTYIEQAGYVEARRTLTPRWYVAARAGYLRSSLPRQNQVYEIAAGYRPDRRQLIKLDYEAIPGPLIFGRSRHTIAIQLVTTFGPLAAWAN